MRIIRPFVARGIWGLCFVVSSALPSVAQQGVGAINGRVTDATGGVLPGATVTLASDQGTIGGNQETVVDERGAYQFLRLVPGTYSVRAQLSGFRTVAQPNIVVSSEVTARADLRLEVGTVEESILVSGTAPLLDTSNALKQTIISHQELEALPNRTDVWAIARVIPGVVISKIDTGGAEAFNQSGAAVRGSGGENKFMVDGMDVSSPSGAANIANFYLDPFSFEATTFQVGAGSAENSAGGLNFNMITRTGTNQWHGGAKFNGTSPAWANARNYSDELRAQLLAGVPAKALAVNPNLEPGADIQRMSDVGVWVAGPIVRDKLWWATTWHDQRLDQHVLGGYNADGTQSIDDNALWNVTNKVSWQVTNGAQLSYFNDTQYKLNGHFGGNDRASFAEDKAKQFVYKYPTVNQVKFTTPLGSRMAFDVTYSRFRSDNAFLPEPGVQVGDIPRFDSTTAVASVALASFCTGGTSCSGYYTTPLYREQVKTSLSWSKSAHDLKFGYEFVDITRDTRAWSISPFQANYANGLPTSVNTYTLPVADVPDPRDHIPMLFTYRAMEQGAFIQDKWTLHRKLVVNLGLRYETNDSWQPPACVPQSQFFAGACYDKVTAPSYREFAPRFSLVYDVVGNGRMVLKFSANRYNLPLSVDPIGRLNPITAPFDTRQWLPQSRCGEAATLGCDRNGDLIPQLAELGPSPGYVFAGVNARYQDDLERAYAKEYTVEFQRELPQGVVFSVEYADRRTRNNLGSVNTAAPPSSWIGPTTVAEVSTGQAVQVWNRGTTASSNLFYNSADLDTTYNGLDLTFSKRMSHRWSILGGATFSKARQATRGGNRNDPNIFNNPFEKDVITGNDRPWSYRASGVYELPYRFFVSGTWQYMAGAPETTTVLVNNQTITLAQGSQSVVVAPIGSVRFPNTAVLDLNIRKGWRLPGGKTLSPRFEIFNATNQATIVSWLSQLGPTYHRPSSIQHGRMFKLELDFDF